MNIVELLTHPVRLRIVHAFSGDRALTTTQLVARMPDVSKATMYRQVDTLAEHGVLAVVDEQRVRGAVERTYRLRREPAPLDTDGATADDYRHAFVVAMATLLAEFNTYVDRDQADPVADLVGFRQHSIWLSREELVELIRELQAAILPRLTNPAGADRTQYLLSPILFPIDQPGS